MITPIRTDILYLFIDCAFFKAYDRAEELEQAIRDIPEGSYYSVFDYAMNKVGGNSVE